MVIEIPQRPGLLLNDESLRLNDKPADTPIVPQNKELDLDESDLASYILELFRNDIEDKRQMSWVDKRNYDIKAYYGLKDAALSQIPWPNASNFPVPLILAKEEYKNKFPARDNGELYTLKIRGALVDVAPTILAMLGLEKPESMIGIDLNRLFS